MAPPNSPIDAGVGVIIFATIQSSLVAAALLVARPVLRERLSPGARYALWALLALPLLAPLLPATPFRFPDFSPKPHAPAQRVSAPSTVSDAGWRVEYGGLTDTVRPELREKAPPMNWRRLVVGLWALGVGVLGLRVAVTHARAVVHARRGQPVDDPGVLDLLEQCRDRVGLRRTPRAVSAPPGAGPAVLGLLRPRLLLPAGASASLSHSELRFVLLHELVHLKRGDLLAEWLLTLLQLAQWFNPLIWLAASRCRADREEACDAAVLALTGRASRNDYGRTILRLATELSLSPRPSPAVGILETASSLERRLRMIAAEEARPARRWPAALVAVFALALVAATNAEAPAAEDAPADDPPKPAARPDPVPRGKPDPVVDPLNAWRELTESDLREEARKDAEKRTRDRAAAEKRAKEDIAIIDRLDRRLPEINFDGVGLSDVVDFLRDVSGANIFVNWKALEAAGVDRTAPVSARLRDIKFAKALTVLLDSVQAREPLGYHVEDGVITISTQADLEKDTVTRVYDVRDLMVPIPDYDPPPVQDMNFDGPKPAEKPPVPLEKEAAAERTRSEQIDALTRLIQETIDPDAWKKVARLRELQGQLIVTAPPRLHEDLVRLLEQLRETRGLQVSVEARFLAVDDEVLAALPPDLRRTVEGELRAAKDPVRVGAAEVKPPDKSPMPPAKDASKVVVLDPEQVDLLLKAVQGSAHSTILTAPRITLFNGQGGYVVTGTSRAYAADYVVIKENDGQTRYEPQIATVQSGVTFWSRATVSSDRKYATLSLRPRLTQLAGMDEVAWDRSPPDQKLTVMRPNLLASEVATTVSVKDGSTLLLGGLKGYFGKPGEPNGLDAKPAAGQAQNVLLLVKPTLIIQREVEERQFPLPKAEKKGAPGE
jgi:beta-lactamase regulating signal transducer with metallopeptidase domain